MTAQVDPFMAASPTYRRAISQASKPMPLLAGEVATFSRRRPPRSATIAGTILRHVPALICTGVLIAIFWSGLA